MTQPMSEGELPKPLKNYRELAQRWITRGEYGGVQMRELCDAVERLQAERDRLWKLLDRARPQLVCLHGLICNNLEGAAAEQVVHDLVADILKARAAVAAAKGDSPCE